MFEDIVTLGCSVFADHILFDEEYPCPINDVVFSDEMPIYDFGKTLEEIEHKIYEIRGKFNIDTKRSLDALVREIKEIKKESEDTNKNPDKIIYIYYWIVSRIALVIMMMNFLVNSIKSWKY